MKIQLTNKYKSLQAFKSDDIPDFTVIIGKNGSGKSQLVQKFSELSKSKTPRFWNKVGLVLNPEVKNLFTDTLVIDNIESVNPTDYREQYIFLFKQYTNFIVDATLSKVWGSLFEKKVLPEVINKFNIENIEDVYAFKELLSSPNFGRFVTSDIEHLNVVYKPGEDKTIPLFNMFLQELKLSLVVYEVSVFVAEYHRKSLYGLGENDFFNANIPVKYLEKNDLIESKIEYTFYNYLRKRHKNSLSYFQKAVHKHDNPSVSPDEFNENNANPFLQINEILGSVALPYYFKEITEQDFSPETNTHFDFIKKSSGEKILVANLSSGEKIILGLIIRLFTSEFYKIDFKFPDLIILDEPDANLHPEMSKILIQVLNETFVKKIGIKVIITTHSPTTVALAPDESIFQLINEPETSLKKILKDDALKILTSGLPNLSIDYKNHRHIFVESPTDLDYYRLIFDKYNADTPQTHKLYFISNALGKGNCTLVTNIVTDLRAAGNNTAYGIIDWDKSNQGKPPLYVHGKAKRYSIENYIFDPVYLSILLLEKEYGPIMSALDYKKTDIPYDIFKLNKAQAAIDYFVNILEPRNRQTGMNKNNIEHTYGSYSCQIPIWFSEMQGHKLKDQLIDQVPILEVIKKAGKYEIENRLVNIIARMYPSVPGDTIELFRNLSS